MINKYSNGQRLAHRIPINKYHTKFRLTATTKLADEVIIVFDTPWIKNHNYQNISGLSLQYSSKTSYTSFSILKCGD